MVKLRSFSLVETITASSIIVIVMFLGLNAMANLFKGGADKARLDAGILAENVLLDIIASDHHLDEVYEMEGFIVQVEFIHKTQFVSHLKIEVTEKVNGYKVEINELIPIR